MELDPQVTQDAGPGHSAAQGHHRLPDDPERYVVQGIHMIIEGDHQRPWRDDEKRHSRLVFIGRNLDRKLLETEFEACAA